MIQFQKWQALGNDFVIIDNRNNSPLLFSKKQITTICHRHLGIGCDQLIIIKSAPDVDCEMLIYNQDGSKALACGNAARCVAKILNLRSSKIMVSDQILQAVILDNDNIKINIGRLKKIESISFPYKLFKEGYSVDVGNQHLVFFLNEIDNFDFFKWGPYFENHKKLFQTTNVEFVKIQNKNNVEALVWERGVGQTSACGSGACAIALTGINLGKLSNKVYVKFSGGKILIEIKDDEIFMIAPAQYVFSGVFQNINYA